MELQRSSPPLSWVFNEKYRWVFHLMFWMFVYLDEVLSVFGITTVDIELIYLLPGFVADLCLVYFNLYFLLPKFLLKNRLWEYLGYTLLTLLVNVAISGLDYQEPFDFSNPDDLEFYIDNYFFMLMYTGVILGAAVGIKFFKSYILNQEKVNELETTGLKTELAFLKNQINPHFLFNCLNNIYVQSRKRSEEASESILLLSDLLRYQLYDCGKEKVLLRNEIEYLKNYLKLDGIRKKKPSIDFQVHGAPNGILIAPFLFIPFVENAVKYGLMEEENNYLKIIFKIEPAEISFYIENAQPKRLSTSEVGGIGLSNVSRRLELLYFGRYELKIEDLADKYIVNLVLKTAP